MPGQEEIDDLKINNIIDSKNIEPVIDSKDIELQNITVLTTTVKVENTSDVSNNDNDYSCGLDDYNDFYDTKDNIAIITKTEEKPKRKKIKNVVIKNKKCKEKSVSLVTKYKKYARLLRAEKRNWGASCESYFTKKNLTEAEIEEYLNQTDRIQRSFANTPYKCKECVKGYLRAADLHRHNDLNHHKVSLY